MSWWGAIKEHKYKVTFVLVVGGLILRDVMINNHQYEGWLPMAIAVLLVLSTFFVVLYKVWRN